MSLGISATLSFVTLSVALAIPAGAQTTRDASACSALMSLQIPGLTLSHQG
jgi:hypothetical protein